MKNIDFKNLNLDSLSSIDMGSLNETFSHFVDKIKQDTPFQKKVGISALIIVGCLLGTNLINDYQQVKIEEASSKQSEYEEIQSFMKKHKNNADEYKNSIAQVKGKLIEQDEIDKANLIVAKLAEADGVTITSNKKSPKTDNIGNNIHAQTTSLMVEGNYQSILKFINDVENEDFFSAITTLSINAKNTKKETPDIISAKVDYQIFYSTAKDSKTKSSDNDKSSNKEKSADKSNKKK